MSPDPAEAAAALASIRESRGRMPSNACPPWRHAVFAGLLSGVVAAQALPMKLFFALICMAFVGMAVTYIVIKARKGVFINGWRAGATRGVSMAIFGVYLAIYTATWWLKLERGLWFAPWWAPRSSSPWLGTPAAAGCRSIAGRWRFERW